MAEWNDQVVIITGASSGIGKGIAIEFAKLGCALVLTGRDETNLKDTAEKCVRLGIAKDKVLCIIADMLKDEDVKSIVTKAIEKFGKINVLVNNAGMAKFGALPNLNMADFDDIMQVNLRSVVLLTQEAIPHLIKTKGNIVNISSIFSAEASPGLIAYNMSKAALDHFTRCSALDLGPHKVRINSILPGMIETPIFEKLGLTKEEVQKLYERNASEHPMGRLGTPEEIGRVAVFLASDNASFVTGQTIIVNGGGIPRM